MAMAIDLWEQYKETNDPELREQLILQYAPLVKYVVGRTAISLPSVLDSDDIIGHATLGLIDAVERFDPRRGIKFETYAITRIRGSIIDAVRRLGVYPRGARRKMKAIQEAIAALENRNATSPTDEEVAAYLGISVEEYSKELYEASFTVMPLEMTWRDADDEDALSLVDAIADTRDPSPPEEAERAELRAALVQAIERLAERERLLLALYYQEELTLKEISHVLEISESRVCQLHTRILLRLRQSLVSAGLAPVR